MSGSVAQMAVAEAGLSVADWVARVMLEGYRNRLTLRRRRWRSGYASVTRRQLHRLYAAGPVRAVGHDEQASSCARSLQGV
jgi:hypothetical protein